MAKELRCADLGMKCSAVLKGNTEDEVLKQAAAHAQQAHNLTRMDEPMMAKVKAAIRTV
jgi:predicted small metal-binding protein